MQAPGPYWSYQLERVTSSSQQRACRQATAPSYRNEQTTESGELGTSIDIMTLDVSSGQSGLARSSTEVAAENLRFFHAGHSFCP